MCHNSDTLVFVVCVGQGSLLGVKAIQWGVEHERDAISMYEKTTGNQVQPCGLVLAPNGFLGVSPDGFVGSNIVVEVKCPWRLKDKSITDVCRTDKTFFLGMNSATGSYFLKDSHDYFHQVQGQMYLTGRELCHFVIWSPSEQVVIEIPKDDLWEENVAQLSTFYTDTVVPKLLEEYAMRTAAAIDN